MLVSTLLDDRATK